MYDEDLINRSESLLIVAILVFTKYALVEFGIHSKEIGAPKCGMRPILKNSIEVLHASRDIIATVATPPSCMPGQTQWRLHNVSVYRP